MIELLRLGPSHGWDKLAAAIGQAAELGCGDAAVVRYLLRAEQFERATPEVVDVAGLRRFERPLPTVSEYDQLLAAEVCR